MSEELYHYGIPRRSGRYPWGSGKDPYQRTGDFLARVSEMKKSGMSQTDIAKELGMTTTQLRSEITLANQVRKDYLMNSVKSMKERGLTNVQIAKELDIAESSVRNYISNQDKIRKVQVDNVADALKDSISQNPYLDVGKGVELQLGVSKEKLKAAVAKLKEEGYEEHILYVKRLGDPSKTVTVKVLTKPGVDLDEVKAHSDEIMPPVYTMTEGGLGRLGMQPIKHIDPKRVKVLYSEDGGEDKDGLIEIRRGAKDLDLGNAKYAQVRIAVGPDRFLKGMAIYSDDLPAGTDIVFNTNKSKKVPKMETMKKLKDDPDNPFGATIKPGGQRGALNIVNEEGDWHEWSKELSAQFLSKQPHSLVKDRLNATYKSINKEYNDIMSMTNPAVKKVLLEQFANNLDTKTRHLKALGLPKTKGHVILPFPDMKSNEVYAPNYKDGERVVLIRYPHGGIFELPELTVNNRGPAKKIIKNAKDAIGIHPSVAKKLSGADFDGDTVWVVPNNKGQIKTSRSLKELENFDPNWYKVDRKTITNKRKQMEMGEVSNLITDMTIKKAPMSDIAKAVKHSMVVIDSEKHNLDWKKSKVDNNIQALKKKYQSHISPVTGRPSTGASTLISRSKGKIMVGGKKEKVLDKKTGKMKTKLVGGKKTYLMDMFPDAHSLSSGTAVENSYADYANKLKALKNKVQKSYSSIKTKPYSKEAAKVYKPQVNSLTKKLNLALLNAPRERVVQLQANKTFYSKFNKSMTAEDIKKLRTQSLAGARAKFNPKGKPIIKIEPKEWEAIQAGAISNSKLMQILNNADMDIVKKLAMPKPAAMSSAKVSRAKAMLRNGKTYAEVAEALGVSTSTIHNAIEGG